LSVWQKGIKKTLFTLATEGWEPDICDLTFPLLKRYADKIGADFYQIKDRKFPDWPHACEKLQIFNLAQEMENDWNVYVDADALVHPETPDITLFLPRDTVAHNGADFSPVRWKFDRFFWRDGRYIGSCNWFTAASDWCVDLWHPPVDLTPEEAASRIFPTVNEELTVKTSRNLIDDYLLARNIAKFGLKFMTFESILKEKGFGPDNSWFFWHQYTVSPEEKLNGWEELDKDNKRVHVPGMKDVLRLWRLL
jgi:hypothetical protein